MHWLQLGQPGALGGTISQVQRGLGRRAQSGGGSSLGQGPGAGGSDQAEQLRGSGEAMDRHDGKKEEVRWERQAGPRQAGSPGPCYSLNFTLRAVVLAWRKGGNCAILTSHRLL